MLAPKFFSGEFEALIRNGDVLVDVSFGQGGADEPVVVGVGVEEYPAAGRLCHRRNDSGRIRGRS
jgi:hypothetical protein